MTNLIITILAGGMGTRMKSSIPKVLHHYKNKPMIVHIIEQVIQFDPFKIIIVVGIYEKIIRETINKYHVYFCAIISLYRAYNILRLPSRVFGSEAYFKNMFMNKECISGSERSGNKGFKIRSSILFAMDFTG